MNGTILCLTGPTATGKSAVAMALAERFPIEIVSVDSALVYRGMDIGTAKPKAAERARVRHHLIDIIDAHEAYSAARFCQDADHAIEDILARQRMPLLVGGTMLYFKALRDGLDVLPAADADVRARLREESAALGWPALHERLGRVDPAMANRISPNDAQRIGRALEVWQQTGKPLSALWNAPSNRGNRNFVYIALEPAVRADLHARIKTRFDEMLRLGLIDEVRRLHARGDLHPALPSMRSVGYRQVWQYLDGQIEVPLMRSNAIAATRQLAKRQLTWLRQLPDRHVIDCFRPDLCEKAIRIVGNEWPEFG